MNNFNDGTTKPDFELNRTKTAVDASHQSGDVPAEGTAEEHQKVDGVAMDSAKRAQNRIHQSEQEAPDSTLFTK